MKRRVSVAVSIILTLALMLNVTAVTLLALPTSAADAASASATAVDYTRYVNLFNGTAGDHGQLSPAAQVPNGLVKLGPDTWPKVSGKAQSGYNFYDLLVRGFSHTRVEGTGNVGSGGDVRIMPSLSMPTAGFDPDLNGMYKANEYAEVGYYKTDLTPTKPNYTSTNPDEMLLEVIETDPDTTVSVELTADVRTGYHKYVFPTDTAYFYVDLGDALAGRPEGGAYIEITGSNSLSGFVIGGNVTARTTNFYKLYFTLEFNRDFTTVSLYDNGELLTENNSELGKNVGAVISFDAASDTPIYAKVTLSPISVEQAVIDMASEAPDWDFDAARASAKADWQKLLSRVAIEDSREDEHTADLIEMFYTSVYRMLTMPVNVTSTSGTYMGSDGNVHDAGGYTHYDGWSLWDDYRKYPLIGIFAPDLYRDIIRSISDVWLHRYENGRGQYYVAPNVGYEHSITLLADGIAKGVWFEDMDLIYEAMKSCNGRFRGSDYNVGYMTGSEAVSDTLEYAYDDYCQALVAKALAEKALTAGDAEKYEYFESEFEFYISGSFMYRNLWLEDATTNSVTGEKIGLFAPKDESGNWVDFDPFAFGKYAYEGCAWVWRWCTPHDVMGAAELAGGTEKMLADLTYFFDNNWFTAVNETDLQAPYMFNYLGAPHLTQYWVHNVYTEATTQVFHNHGKYSVPITDYVYKNQMECFPESMDEDTGTMSAMYFAATLGLFPFVAGDGTVQIGSPAFERVTVSTGNGRDLVIEADGVSRDNYYIQSATLNGRSINRTWLDYSELVNGGTLTFKMGSDASDFAADGILPVSASQLADDRLEDLILNTPSYKGPDDSTGTDISTEGGYSTPEEYDVLSDYLAYWRLDGTLDDEGGAYNLTSSAAPGYDTGRLGNAIKSPGTAKPANYDPVFGFGTKDFSVSVWFNATANGNIIGREETTYNHGWCLRIDGGYLQFSAHDNAKYRIASTTLVNDGVWHHAALTVKDGVAYLYLDGAPVGTTSGFGSLDIDDYSTDYEVPFSIGYRSQVRSGVLSTGNTFAGLVDEVRIYDKALSASHINALYASVDAEENENEGPLSIYWPFEQSTVDESGKYELSPTSSTEYGSGKFDTALLLSGNALLSSDSALDFGSGDFAVALWVNIGAVENKTIIGKADTTANTGWALRVDGGVFQLSIKDNVPTYGVADTAKVEANRWYHLAAVRSGGTVYLYVDGVCVGSNSAIGTASLSSAASFAIGARISGGSVSSLIKASVDDVRIFGYSLDASEIDEIYKLVPERELIDAPADYVAYWMLNGNLNDVRSKYNLSSTIDTHGYGESMSGFGSALGNVSATGSAPFTDSADFDFGSESFALSLWYKVPENGATTIISKEDYGTVKSGWSIRINNGYLQFNTPKNTNYRISVTAPTANEWHHVVVSRDGGTLYMYVDGVLVGSTAIGTFSLSSDNPLRFGARTTNGNPTQYLNGFIDEVKIYRHAVSAEEALALYKDTPSTIIFIDGNDTFREGTESGSLAGVVLGTVTVKLGTGEEFLDGELTYEAVNSAEDIVFGEGDVFAKLSGLPDGLTPVFTRIDGKTVEISLVGKATYNDGALGELLHIEINPAYILSTDGTPLTGESRIVGAALNLPIKLYAGRLNYSTGIIKESERGSGVLGTVITVTLTDESGSGIPSVSFNTAGLIIGKDVTIENLPDGISAVAKLSDDGYTLNISFVGKAKARIDTDDISIIFAQSAFSDSTKVIYNVEKTAVSADFDNLKLWYSQSALYESKSGDGSVSGAVTVRLTDMKFSETDGSLLPIDVSGLPEGLSVSAVRLGDYEAKIVFDGRASAHMLDDTVTVKVAFGEGAFEALNTEYIECLSDEITLRFKNPTVTLSGKVFVEAPENDGSIYLPIYASLDDDKESFFGIPGEDLAANGKLEIKGLPDGLSAEAILLSDGRIRISLIGNASSHDIANNVGALSLIFTDDAFMGWKSSGIAGAVISALAGPGIFYTNAAGAACEHTFADADCDAPKTCTACGYMTGEALGHTYSFKAGTLACDVCGDVIELPYDNEMYKNYRWELTEDGESYKPVFDPAFNPAVNLTLFRDISLNIAVPYTLDISKIEVSACDEEGRAVSVRVIDKAMNVNGTLYHKMQITGIRPERIDERFTVSFEITGRYGEVVTKSFTTSIKDYADRALEANSASEMPSAELEEMLKAIKAYGEAAKIYVEGGECECDVNDFSGYVDAVNPVSNGSFSRAALNLNENFNWYIETTADEIYATYYYDGVLMENVRIDAEDGVAKITLKARDLLKTVTVTAGEDELSFNFTYYAMAVIEIAQSDADITDNDVMALKYFLDAIYRYSDSADRYAIAQIGK